MLNNPIPANPGFLYVLVNSSMPGLVKVGRTNRKPSERAQELSGSTGVPTPFTLVYEIFVNDCNEAEKFIHTILSNNGYRLANNREFFKAPVSDIINLLNSLPQHLTSISKNQSIEHETEKFGNISNYIEISRKKSRPWQNLWEEAESYHFGIGKYLQDTHKAIKYYLESTKLGCSLAYFRLGDIYNRGYEVPKNKSNALDFFTKGAELGNFCCYLHMFAIYYGNDNIENAIKCLDRYFEAIIDSSEVEELTELFEYDALSGFVGVVSECYRSRESLEYLSDNSLNVIRSFRSLYLKDCRDLMRAFKYDPDKGYLNKSFQFALSLRIEELTKIESWLLQLK